jgi:hypothetical protein
MIDNSIAARATACNRNYAALTVDEMRVTKQLLILVDEPVLPTEPNMPNAQCPIVPVR